MDVYICCIYIFLFITPNQEQTTSLTHMVYSNLHFMAALSRTGTTLFCFWRKVYSNKFQIVHKQTVFVFFSVTHTEHTIHFFQTYIGNEISRGYWVKHLWDWLE